MIQIYQLPRSEEDPAGVARSFGVHWLDEIPTGIRGHWRGGYYLGSFEVRGLVFVMVGELDRWVIYQMG